MALLDNLKHYWKLDESSGNAINAFGGLDLTNTGTVTYVSGKINNSADFDGTSNQRLSASNNLGFDSGGNFSFSFWFSLDAFGAGYIVDLTSNTTNQRRILVYVGATNTVKLFASGNEVESGTLSTGTWYHCVVTSNSSGTLELFINGSSQGTTSMGTLNYNNNEFSLGAPWDSFGSLTNGQVDEFGAWNKVLTSDEITELYGSGSGNAFPFSDINFLDNLLLHTDMEDASATTVNESTGTYTLTKASSGNPVSGTGQVGNCQVFTTDYITSNFNPNTSIGTGDVTVAIWFKTASADTRRVFFYMGEISGTFQDVFMMQAGNNADGNPVLVQGRVGTSGTASISASSLQDDGWHLAIATRSGTTAHLYIDNSEIGTGSTDAEWGADLGVGFRIGAGQDLSNNLMTGSLDEIGIWGKVLTSAERAELWNSGAGLAYSSFTAGGGGEVVSTPVPTLLTLGIG